MKVNVKFNQKINRIITGAMSSVMTISVVPVVSVNAKESTELYSYAIFAASDAEGVITINAGNGNVNINGTKTEDTDEDMIYMFDKIDTKYFSENNVEAYAEDYTLEELSL